MEGVKIENERGVRFHFEVLFVLSGLRFLLCVRPPLVCATALGFTSQSLFSANRLSAAASLRVEGGGEGHFRGGGEAVFGLAPGTGLEGEGQKKRF